MLHKLISEATECDFKSKLEIRKPKSWLKSVSAFTVPEKPTSKNQKYVKV